MSRIGGGKKYVSSGNRWPFCRNHQLFGVLEMSAGVFILADLSETQPVNCNCEGSAVLHEMLSHISVQCSKGIYSVMSKIA